MTGINPSAGMIDMIQRKILVAAIGLMLGFCQNALAQSGAGESFDIRNFAVEGNSLLSPEQIEKLLAPFSGEQKVYRDVQNALEALDAAYRAAGYHNVKVMVPEQELTQGVVRLTVAEGVSSKAAVSGNKPVGEAPVNIEPPAPVKAVPPIEAIANVSTSAPVPVLADTAPVAAPATETADTTQYFDIQRFAVEGNSLLSAEKVDQLITPFSGKKRVYGDIQRALEALEGAYRGAGYNTVQVHVPEQELAQGVVKLKVTEGMIGKVIISGNKHFSEENIRAGLPALQEGTVPNARLLSENIQLSNDNPAKQVEVTLGVGEEENKIDVKVAVTEENPQKFIATLDNTGAAASGKHRVGIAYQNANMFQLDHTMTMAYTTSPDAPGGVHVDIYSMAYRLPLYRLGDSIDLVYGNSSVNTPSVQATGFGLTGKGEVGSVRFNHYFPRQGEFSSKATLGIDYKYFNTRCSINGVPQAINPPLPALASCTPYTTRPISATYSGQWQGAGSMADYNVGAIYNLPLGSKYLFNGSHDHYSLISNRPVSNNFTALRVGGSYMTTVFTDWQARLAFSGQHTNRGLVAGEQLGLAGSTAVRGFNERAVATDSGHLVNLEAYTPDLAGELKIPGNLRGVLFYDFARGKNIGVVVPSPSSPDSVGIAAGGLGLRYNVLKDFNLRADVAEVTKAGPAGTESRGDWRGHFNMSLSF